MTEKTTGSTWIDEQRRLCTAGTLVGPWARAFVWRARSLRANGLLPLEIGPSTTWRGARLPNGVACYALRDDHRQWLVDQAVALTNLSKIKGDPIGRCAKHFMDWLIWFWTADGCHPTTFTVRRDGIKHDYRHLHWSDKAAEEINKARRNGTSVSSVVEHEHAVPKRLLIDIIICGRVEAAVALHSFARAALVTKGEHIVLNREFKDKMPLSWNSLDAHADPFARYKDPLVSINLNDPLGIAG